MAVLGTYLVNFHHNNILLMLMIVVIALVALLIGFDKFIPVKLYPLAIWVMAISLIYHVTLISQYLNINDVVREYCVAAIVVKNSFWDWTIFGNYNAVLSVAMLAPIFHHIYNLNLIWVFKIIYPLLFSFVPLAVYSIFLNEIKSTKAAFLSSFLFISILPFIYQVPLITKQSTAEIFLALLLMVTLNKNITRFNLSILSIIFAASLIVSHYGTSYLIMVSIIFVSIFSYFTDNKILNYLFNKKYFKFKEWGADDLKVNNRTISLTFVLIFITFTIAWYLHISSSSAFNTIVHIGHHITNTLFMEFLSPESSRGLYMLTREETSLLRACTKYLYLITQFFIIVGFLEILLTCDKSKVSRTYLGLSTYFIIVLLMAIAVSSFAAMDPRRLFHLSLFTLAPFSIIGGLTICKMITKIFKIYWTNKMVKLSLNVLSVFLVIFLLFNTGFMYEIAKDHPLAIPISQETIKKYGDIDDKAKFYGGYIMTQNVFSGKWVTTNMRNNEIIYRGDLVQGYPSLTIYGGIDEKNIQGFDNTTTEIGSGYVQLSYANVVEGVGSSWYNPLHKRTAYNFTDVCPLLADKSKIYDNGGSEISWS
jgi:uncharacterized membrane protein